jgi:hypothetical protein
VPFLHWLDTQVVMNSKVGLALLWLIEARAESPHGGFSVDAFLSQVIDDCSTSSRILQVLDFETREVAVMEAL